MMTARELARRVKPYVPAHVRSRLVRVRFRLRRPTARWRALPDVLVIGAMRGGTSSLFKYLSEHPEMSPSLRKEVEYFTRHWGSGELWYRSHFGLELRRRAARRRGRRLLFFEATPYYLFDPRAAARAHGLLPDARIIAVLRDPVERAWSDYRHMCRHGFERLEFEPSLDAEEGRVAAERARMAADETYFSRDHHHFSYFARGQYAEQLERWLSLYPSEQVLLLESADLYADPAGVMRTICEFLGLTPRLPHRFGNHSYVGRPPAAAPMDPALRDLLRERYREDDERLARIWGRVPGWRR